MAKKFRMIRKIMQTSELPRTQTSLFWWKCAREGRREGAFPWSLAVHHQSLVLRSPLPCEKRSAWGGGWTSEGVTTSLFAPSILALRPRHCYLKYPPNKRSGARDWGKGSRWKRVRASPTYRDSSTFKIHSFPTSNSFEVPKAEYMKWWFSLYSQFDPTYALFNILYFFVCRALKQHKNCRPKNSCEEKSFLVSYELLVYGASIMIQIKV